MYLGLLVRGKDVEKLVVHVFQHVFQYQLLELLYCGLVAVTFLTLSISPVHFATTIELDEVLLPVGPEETEPTGTNALGIGLPDNQRRYSLDKFFFVIDDVVE